MYNNIKIINNLIIKFCLLGVFFITTSCIPITLGGIGASSYQQHMIRTKISGMEEELIKLKEETVVQNKLIDKRNKSMGVDTSMYGPYSDDIIIRKFVK